MPLSIHCPGCGKTSDAQDKTVNDVLRETCWTYRSERDGEQLVIHLSNSCVEPDPLSGWD